jgi:uncharacterized protein (TIGR00661 family)
MRILYGIQLTGNGHISRSTIIINKLKDLGHQVDVITSGSGHNLSLPNIKYKFKGLTLQQTKGQINWIKTILKSKPIRLIKDIRLDVSQYDLVISDFEPISAWSAKLSGVKSISICNQMSIIINNNDWNISKVFMKYFAKCDHLIGLDYESSDNIFQPIFDIQMDQVESDNFYLVYLPYLNSSDLLNILSGANFKIYTNDDIIGKDNIEIKRINKDEFMFDLTHCKGVITHSGFSTTSETLILNKKLWSIPIVGQYEQEINAHKLSKMGVYTGRLSKDNLSYWLNDCDSINYKWSDPIDSIIKKIIHIYEKD